ncbi:aldo/keto reductase [Paenibacillus mucilaginosus]|uniref:aldo/keto reductase n=1 Tax=Paenibacillus mucilaginosus TaxID=61624 RepID=UPI003D24E1B0
MLKRQLGRSGIEVSALGIGCWAIGGPWTEAATGKPFGWGEVNDRESIEAIHCALDSGITLIDTSDNYGAGHSEKVIGQALKGRRSGVVIATKFGYVTDETTKEARGAAASPAYIRQACEASLRRLQTDYIDLYQFHLGDYPPDLAPEVMGVLEEIAAEGKIRYYGWSTDDPGRAEVFAHGRHCTAIQHEMNVFRDNTGMLELCAKQRLASINRGPLAMGLLTGKYSEARTVADPQDIRGRNDLEWLTYFQNGVPSADMSERLQDIRDLLTSGGRTLAQGALGWLWARSEWTIPIPGFRTVKQVTENAGALEHGPLTSEQVAQMEKLMTRGAAAAE